ncbi:DNA methyltransferase [Streptococcus alactolyticus]|uniref:site-specific DNA-methyltransferase (adenine-specific) n=6 Tax=Streptococcus TaxID=1301 RepID=A0ABY7LX33_STRAY|nr:DNA methyltransferase [Streptococcus alactolyticus]MDE2587227.1 class I SAM-dependent DNA methyltransferase [Lactobacillales bacterium]WBB06146.1 N-6 DNA methylase [Streptococcus alactolyticus]
MAKFDIVSIEDKTKELLENLDESGFFYDFLGLYDFPKATLTRLRKNNGNEVKNKALFEVIGQGQSVVAKVAEMEKALSSKKSKPRILIATDFEELAAKDIQTADTLNISLKDLPAYVDFFLPWNGVEKVDYAKENPADIKAAARFTRLYDELRQINQFSDQTTEEKEFNLFLIRLLFLLFAEDTEIMPKGIFTNAIKTRSAEDGSDLDNLINKIFASLDVANRSSQEKWLQEFPYVNGKLFTKAHTALVFDRKTRKLIIEAGELLNWNEINPDILGAMIQTVASKEQRSVSGMHYTSVENIMKVIKPLFLDDLTASYQNLVDKINENEDKDITDKTRRENRNTFIRELESLLDRISNIKFLDPACGSGNFLIITYKEIRRLEVKILKSLRELRQDGTIDFFETSKISLNQFYGIELDDFAHEVARLSLWIAEYQMNLEAENEINLKSAFLPLRDAGNITQGNALRLDWNEILPHQSDDEIYLIGNPPYIGSKLQNKEQKEDLKYTIGEKLKYKKMDYIAGWFFKGVEFINSANSKLAFVTTNSIFQGEQVGFVWEPLLDKMTIDFAYTSFKWGNSAANNAGVTVAIVGLANNTNAKSEKYIFDETLNRVSANHINPYLTSGEDILVKSANAPLNNLPKMVFGSMPRDGGYLIISTQEERNSIISEYPELSHYIKNYVGSEEFIKDKHRYVFWLNEKTYQEVRDNSIVQKRVEAVKANRLASSASSTQAAAKTPYAFVQKGEYDEAYATFKASGQDEFLQLVVPAVSSESREYVPLGFVGEDTIVSNRCYVVYNSPIWLLGLLQSKLHMVWLRSIGGKLKTDYSYSSGVVYNTFPVPELSTRRKNMIEEQVFEILDLREELGGTLAELYHKETMPESLREAHKKLDEIVERAYKDTPFNSDEERLSHLLKRYKEMTHE